MITRTHTLQRQLIRRTEEVAEKDKLIQHKEKLYVELKAILARQPGPEVAEQLTIYQDNLSEKQKQLKAMTAELNMHRQQVSDLKLERESLNARLAGVKKRYFTQMQRKRRQDQMALELGAIGEMGEPTGMETLGFSADGAGGGGGGATLQDAFD